MTFVSTIYTKDAGANQLGCYVLSYTVSALTYKAPDDYNGGFGAEERT